MKNFENRIRRICIAACIALVLPYATAQQSSPEVTSSGEASDRSAGTIQSVADADSRLAAMAKERAAIEARFKDEEQACHPKFFATSCIDEAQERRRMAMAKVRAVEIEANAFKRNARAVERDKSMEERQAKTEVDRMGRLKQRQQAADALPGQHERASVNADNEAARRTQATIFSDRQEQHDARMARLKAEDAARSKKRAENIAAYDRKVEAAKARQLEVAKRKAEKEKKRRAKQASVSAGQ